LTHTAGAQLHSAMLYLSDPIYNFEVGGNWPSKFFLVLSW